MKHHHPIQISIPQPCHEDWNKMTPQEQGRFCDSCQKCVVDFTGFTDEQLYKYFAEHRIEKVCGRFQNWQLKRVVALPPEPCSRFYRWVISLGLVVFLTKMFSSEAVAQESTEIISGRVTNMKNKSLANVQIKIYNDEHTVNIHSDVNGNFSSILPVSGNYNLFIQDGNFKTTTIKNIPVSSESQTYLTIGLLEKKENDTFQVIRFDSPQTKTISDANGVGTYDIMGQVRLDERFYIVNNPKSRSLKNLWYRTKNTFRRKPQL